MTAAFPPPRRPPPKHSSSASRRRRRPWAFKTVGFDIDPEKADRLSKGESYIGTVQDSRVAEARKNGFHPTADYSLAAKADALIICVPTPLSKTREPQDARAPVRAGERRARREVARGA